MATAVHYYRLDALKSVAAFMVVLIHTSTYLPHTDTETFWNYGFYRASLEIAVPTFFAISGYLIGGKAPAKILKYAGKIFTIYVAATLLYMAVGLLFAILNIAIDDEPAASALSAYVSEWTLRNFLNGTAVQGHLWFLAAQVTGALILALLAKLKFAPWLILLISATAFSTKILLEQHTTSIGHNDGTPEALFYLAIGLLVWRYRPPSHWLMLPLAVASIAAFTAINLLGIATRSPELVSELCLAVAVLALLSWGANPQAKPNILARAAQYSLTVYILHVALIRISNRVVEYAGGDLTSLRDTPGYPIASGVIIVLGCIALHKPFTKCLLEPVQRGCLALAGTIGKLGSARTS